MRWIFGENREEAKEKLAKILDKTTEKLGRIKIEIAKEQQLIGELLSTFRMLNGLMSAFIEMPTEENFENLQESLSMMKRELRTFDAEGSNINHFIAAIKAEVDRTTEHIRVIRIESGAK